MRFSFLLSAVVALVPWLPSASGIEWRALDEPDCGGWITAMRYSPHDSKRILVCGDMLGVGLSEDGGASWQPTFGFKSWEMADVTWDPADPNVVWVGAVSGPYLSADGGRTWRSRRDGMPAPLGFGNSAPIEKILVDPANSKHVLAFGGSSRRWDDKGKGAMGAVWESRDQGEHWVRIATITAAGSTNAPDAKGINIVSAAFAPGKFNHLYAAVDHQGIYVSEDGGRSWAKNNDGLATHNPERVIAHPKDPNIVFCSLDNQRDGGNFKPGGVFKSSDGGVHWTAISEGLEQNVNDNENFTARYKAFAVCESNPDVMYAANSAWYLGGLFYTKDSGAHWTRANDKIARSYPAVPAAIVFEVDPKDPNTAWCLGAEHMIVTHDGGAVWRDGGNYLPQETKAAWRGRGYSGMCATSIRFNPAVPGESLIQALDSGRAWLSRDNLQTWTRYLDQPDPWGGGNDAAFAGPKVIYATTSRGQFTGIGRSRDAGQTWEILAGGLHGLPSLHEPGDAEGIYALPDAPDKAWACVKGMLYATEDGGDHWKIVHRGPSVHWIAADPRHPERFYVSGEKNVYATNDGEKFAPIGGPHSGGRIAVDARGRVLVTASNSSRNGLWRWDGAHWSRLIDDPWVSAVAADPFDPTRILLATNQNPYCDFCSSSGVWASQNDGQSWSQQNRGLPMLRGWCVAFDPHTRDRVLCGTQGRGFFVAQWDSLPTETAGARTYASAADDAAFAAIDPTPEPAPPPPKQPAQIRNGDMTSGKEIPEHWDQQWVGKGKIKVTRDTSLFHSAPASLSIATEDGDAQGQTAQIIEADGGESFQIEGYVRTAGNVRCNVMAQYINPAGAPVHSESLQFAQGDHDWMQFKKQIRIPEGAVRLGIVLYIEGNGKAWLDDVKLTPP